MKYFLDANVLLEVLLPSRPHAKLAEGYVLDPDAITSPLTAHLYMYFGLLAGMENKDLLNALSLYAFTDMGDAEVRWAINNCPDKDFEDALQIACALHSGCGTFVTFDKRIAKAYSQHIDVKLLG